MHKIDHTRSAKKYKEIILVIWNQVQDGASICTHLGAQHRSHLVLPQVQRQPWQERWMLCQYVPITSHYDTFCKYGRSICSKKNVSWTMPTCKTIV